MTDSMERLIEKIKEAPHPMPRLYRQGWQDACDKISEEVRNSPSGGSDGVVREVVAASAMTDDIKSAVEAARWITERAMSPEPPDVSEREHNLARALLSLASRVEKIEAEIMVECGKWAHAQLYPCTASMHVPPRFRKDWRAGFDEALADALSQPKE
jgi:hypothetical protein